MSGVVTKFKIGTAVLAAAAVTGLTPVLAQAAPDDSGTDTASVGSSAGKSRASRGATTRNTDTGSQASTNNDAPSTDAPGTDAPSTDSSATDSTANRVGNAIANATGTNPLLQNSFWWFGTPNPTPPPSTIITETEPLADLPGWSRSAFGWFTDTNAQACILGLSNTTNGSVGPYGTSTTSFSTSGC